MNQATCDRLFDQIVTLSAHGRCYLCGQSPAEAHHIRFRSHTRDPRIRYNLDYGVALDLLCHKSNPEAPHVDNERFLARLKEKMSWRDPARWERIAPTLGKPVPPYREKIDYRQIARDLRRKLKEIKRRVAI